MSSSTTGARASARKRSKMNSRTRATVCSSVKVVGACAGAEEVIGMRRATGHRSSCSRVIGPPRERGLTRAAESACPSSQGSRVACLPVRLPPASCLIRLYDPGINDHRQSRRLPSSKSVVGRGFRWTAVWWSIEPPGFLKACQVSGETITSTDSGAQAAACKPGQRASITITAYSRRPMGRRRAQAPLRLDAEAADTSRMSHPSLMAVPLFVSQ